MCLFHEKIMGMCALVCARVCICVCTLVSNMDPSGVDRSPCRVYRAFCGSMMGIVGCFVDQAGHEAVGFGQLRRKAQLGQAR